VSLFFERKEGTKVKLPHHFTDQFGNPMDAAQESGTWGDEGKAVERRGALTALLSVALAQRL
jgi:hypothetical protein